MPSRTEKDEVLKILVTGATGLLGSRVVCRLLDRGHTVRAVVRPANRALPAGWNDRADVARADLLTTPELRGLFDDVDVVIHLAAAMRGTGDDPFASTTMGTERLLDAMRRAGTARTIVLAGSCSVYDYSRARRILDEKSPIETESYDLDGYASAKLAQERLARRFAENNGWTLSVLRPAYIYGPGASPAAVAGLALGPLFVVIAPLSRLRLTHVENCADAFVSAAEKRVAGTFNIIDDARITAWCYAGRLKIRGQRRLRVPIPYHAGLAAACLAKCVHRFLLPLGAPRLPGILNPRQYRARFKPLDYDNRLARQALAWTSQPLFEGGCDVT